MWVCIVICECRMHEPLLVSRNIPADIWQVIIIYQSSPRLVGGGTLAEFFPGLNIFTALAVQKLGYSMYCLSFACLTAFLRKVYCQCKVSALLLLAYCRPAACLTVFLRSVYCQCTVSALLLLAYCLPACCLSNCLPMDGLLSVHLLAYCLPAAWLLLV